MARLERALAVHTARDKARLEALIGAGQLAYRLDQPQRCDALVGEAIALAYALGDVRGEAAASDVLATLRIWQGSEEAEAIALRARKLAQAAGDMPIEGSVVFHLALIAKTRSELGKAETLFLESAKLWDSAGCVLRAPLGMQFAGECVFERFDLVGARRMLEAALIQHRRMGNVHDAASALRTLGTIALNEQRLDEARAQCAESLRIFRALQDRNCGAYSARANAAVLFALGDTAGALRDAESAAATFRVIGAREHALADTLGLIASVHATRDDRDGAREALREGLTAQRRTNRDYGLPQLLEAVASMHPDAPPAAALLGCAAALREQWSLSILPAERVEHERRYAAVRRKHANADFDLAVAAGRALTRDDAIDKALGLVS